MPGWKGPNSHISTKRNIEHVHFWMYRLNVLIKLLDYEVQQNSLFD